MEEINLDLEKHATVLEKPRKVIPFEISPSDTFTAVLEQHLWQALTPERIVKEVLKNPWSKTLPPPDVLKMLKQHGIEPMGRLATQAKSLYHTEIQTTDLEGVSVDIQTLLDRADWYRVPLGQGYEPQPDFQGYVFSHRAQGRGGNIHLEKPIKIEGQDGIFHNADVKGNGLGGDARREREKISTQAIYCIDDRNAHHGITASSKPTNEDLFKWFFQHHLENYQKLITHDLVHGALHQQNVKVEAEWGDKVTLADNEKLSEQEKQKKRVRDFCDCYETTLLAD